MLNRFRNEKTEVLNDTDGSFRSNTRHADDPQRQVLMDEEINVDHQQFSISDGEDSFEVEEDAAHTVTEIYRQRRKQRKKSALRLLLFIAACLLLVAISLVIYFSVQAKQQLAASSSANKSNTNDNNLQTTTTSTSKPSPYAPPVQPPHSKLHFRTRSPAITPHHDAQQESTNMSIPQAPNVNLESICSLDRDKCEVECSKAKCCWATSTTCIDSTICALYSPCLVLTQSITGTNNTDFLEGGGGCAAITSQMNSSSLECFPMFRPCNTNADCRELGVFTNCTSQCKDPLYSTPNDVNNDMNISDTIAVIGDLIHDIQNNTTNFAQNQQHNGTSLLFWTRITFDNFEGGWGNFKDAGSNSKLVNLTLSGNDKESQWARIRDNSKESVLPLKETKDVSQYNALYVQFVLVGEGLEKGDTILLEYSPDGGWNWEIVKDWVFGDDDNFRDNKIPCRLNVTFYNTDYEFSVASMIRFRSDANSDSDKFYIDNVEFLGGKESLVDDTSNNGSSLSPNSTVDNNANWHLITFDDFEHGWGNFRDGGADSKLITLENGYHAARIRDDEKESILPLRETKNLTQFRALRVNFLLVPDELEPGDMLLLEYSSDGGSAWQIIKGWKFGGDEDFSVNGIPYNFSVTFYSTNYVFSANALIRFRGDANSNADQFFIDNVEFEGSQRSNHYSYCGPHNDTDSGAITCNPANIPCMQDLDCSESVHAELDSCHGDRECFNDVAATFLSVAENCGNDPSCVRITQSAVEYVDCLTVCDPSIAPSSQTWEIITTDNFESGYGNFVDKGGDSEIVSFVDEKNVTIKMVQLRNGNGVNSSLPLINYYDVSKYAGLRINLVLVFQGIESGDTLLLEYSPEPSSWVIVGEWVFGGNVLSKNNVPYAQEAIFYNSAYTNFTEQARIRVRSQGDSNTDHFLIGNVVFSGLTK